VTGAHAPRTVMVVGATSGIGRSVAHQLAGQGARLVLAARSPETLEQTRQECVGRGAAATLTVPTDVGVHEDVEKLFAQARERFGRLDGVVHGAAVIAYGRFEDVPAEVFDKVITTNVLGTANVARSALQVFHEQQGGSLVLIGSVLGKIATPYMSTYSTSKFAVQGLARILQIEARETPGVQVSLVSPGGVDTPVYDQAGSYLGRHGNPPPPVSAPETVAAKVVAALDKPGRDISAGPVNWVMVTGFRMLPAVYDVLVGPMMRRLGLGKPGVESGPGNVFEPVPEKESVHGRWPHLLG
jgi:short-subunit dehydrogenase